MHARAPAGARCAAGAFCVPHGYSSLMRTDSIRISSRGRDISPPKAGPTGTEASASTTSIPSTTRPNWV